MYFYKTPPLAGQVNEIKQKYQNIYQLLPRADAVYMVIMVHLPANKTTTQFRTGMAWHPGIFKQPDVMESCGGYYTDGSELVH